MKGSHAHLHRIARILTGAVLFFVIALPLAWFAASSFLSREAALRGWPAWADLSLHHYLALAERIPLGALLLQTLSIAVTSSVLALLLALPAALLTARLRGPSSSGLYGIALTLWLIPPIALSLQIYFWFQQLGLYDTYPGLGLLYAVMHATLALILLSPFVDRIPRRVDEMIALDVLGSLTSLVKIYAPILAAPLLVVGVLCFLRAWSELLFASLLTDYRAGVLSTALVGLTSGTHVAWGQLAAAGALSLLPAPLFLVVLVFSLRVRRREISP
uniref:Multiple sugar transport system permease protein n=1 Tax=Candidatus Kentrum sp. SD TaxID=2126332 RepID=A0A450YEG8_9GAMM|nr:MAG: multiple sugar transport system permease protein [Candidatus Kentron sp. SD]VFK45376.1 MAG: multiple sugar transport system permease protein [Candidatus Kentron sp. SD]VFK79535.1 MAG: multiple sugar transport system permease protein [Candidatus Kentron sp. SD]